MEDKVADLLSDKTISPREAGELLTTRPAPSNASSNASWVLAPATRMSRRSGFVVTLVVLAMSLATARLLRVRFDGALDVHLSALLVPWAVILLDALAYLPLTVGVLYLVARVCGSRVRFIDMFVAVGVARLAMVMQAVLAVAFVPVPVADATLPPPKAAVFFAAFALLPLLVWGTAMLFFHFRQATDLRGGRLATAFIVGLIFAEVASKVLLTIV